MKLYIAVSPRASSRTETFTHARRRRNDTEMQRKTRTSIRRFLLHVLPEGFQRIRYYGFLANRDRRKKLALCRQLLGMKTSSQTTSVKDYREQYQELTGRSLILCPRCHQGQMVIVDSLPPALCWVPFPIDSS